MVQTGHDEQSDEVDSRDANPTPSSGLTFVGLLLGALLVTVLLSQLTGPDPSAKRPVAVSTATTRPDLTAPGPDKSIGVDSIKRCPVKLGGLTLGERLYIRGAALERWDCAGLKGPWSLVIRATDGHLGFRSAVVTFPLQALGSGTPVAKPQGGTWESVQQTLTWPLAGSHANITGDLGLAELADLATRISIRGDRPHLAAPEGFSVSAARTFRSPVVHEMRYGAKDLRQSGPLGDGLVFTGVLSGASFESQVFGSHARPAGIVRGKPAMFSDILVGTGILIWESAPGEVTYIGFSGSPGEAGAVEALRTLADQGKVLTPAEWETKDRQPVAASPG